jgi:hypothetical protein
MEQSVMELTVLQDHFMSLKERVSDARKQGMNTRIPEVKLMNIQSKIKMAEVSGLQKDIDKVKNALADIESEMKLLRKEQDFEQTLRQTADSERERLKQEERQTSYLRLSQKEIVDKTNKLIKTANEYLDTKKSEKVYPVYKEIQEIYKYLPKELKREVYQDSIAIFNELRQSGIFEVKKGFGLWLKKLWWRFRK